MITYYISGPMRGYEEYNFPAFMDCEEYLQSISTASHTTLINPARKDMEEGFQPDGGTVSDEDLHTWMRRDITDVAASDYIVLLPGWERSEGARRELAVAKWCGLQPILYNPAPRFGRLNFTVGWDELERMCNEADEARFAITDKGREALADDYASRAHFVLHEDGTVTQNLPLGQELFNDVTATAKRLYAANGWDPEANEVRTVSSTGGEKGVKPQRFELTSSIAEERIAEVFGYGAGKYDDHNWRKGYEWSKSYGALQRHLHAWQRGEDIDPESGLQHLAHAGAHIHFLLEWAETHPEFDDRWISSLIAGAS